VVTVGPIETQEREVKCRRQRTPAKEGTPTGERLRTTVEFQAPAGTEQDPGEPEQDVPRPESVGTRVTVYVEPDASSPDRPPHPVGGGR